MFSFLLNSIEACVPLKSKRTAISCCAWTTALCISAWLISLTTSKEWLSAMIETLPFCRRSRFVGPAHEFVLLELYRGALARQQDI